MEHSKNLKMACRLCGKRSLTGKDKCHRRTEILHLFGIDIDKDDPSVHGNVICKNHATLLTKHMDRLRTASPMVLSFVPYTFIPHSDEQCEICEDKFAQTNQKKTGKELKQYSSRKPDKLSPVESVNAEVAAAMDLISSMKANDRLKLLQNLPGALSKLEKVTLASALGNSESNNVLTDSCNLLSHSAATLKHFDCDTWLNDRNMVVKAFITGIAKHSRSDEMSKSQKIGIVKVIEHVYRLRNQNCLTPLAFMQSLLIFQKTGSKAAVNILSSTSPSGSYKTLQNFLKQIPQTISAFPPSDVIVAFDNEQVFRKRRGIQTQASCSVITNIAYVNLGETYIQQQKEQAPKNWFNIACFDQKAGSDQGEDRKAFQDGIHDIITQESEQYKKLEVLHDATVRGFLDKAIDGILENHRTVEFDTIDKQMQDKEFSSKYVHCPICGAQNIINRRNCTDCGTKGAITEARRNQNMAHNSSDSPKMLTICHAKDVSLEEQNDCVDRYAYAAPENPPAAKKMIISSPVLCNPCSKENIICVLREVGRKAGIHLYDRSSHNYQRQWVTVVVDGLIYVIVKSLKEQLLVCQHDKCIEELNSFTSFVCMEELERHYKDHHSNCTQLMYCREFDWVLLQVADGHFEHTILKTYFDINWTPFIGTLVKELGFTSENQLNFLKAAKDHHLAWEVFVIIHNACMHELLIPYVRNCLQNNTKPTAQHFLATRDKQNETPGFSFMFDQILYYGIAIFNLRAGIRQNNALYVESAKLVLKELLWARNHPKYQVLELYDAVQKYFLPPAVKAQLYEHYAMTTERTGCGEGYDYRLEELNRTVKAFLPKCMPTDQHWLQVCNALPELENIRINTEKQLSLPIANGEIRLLSTDRFVQGINNVRVKLRSSEFLRDAYVTIQRPSCNAHETTVDMKSFKSMNGDFLHPNLLILGELALMKRIHVLHTEFLGLDDPIPGVNLNRPVYITLDEEMHYTSIKNQTNATIEHRIQQLLLEIQDPTVALTFRNKFEKEVKGKRKDILLRMYYSLQDLMASTDSSDIDNGSN